MFWISIHVDTIPIYQLDMCWIFIKLIWLQILSTWYVLDIYRFDICWIFIHVDTIHLSTWYVLDIYHTDMTPIYQLNMSWIFITLIWLQFLSTWYVLDIYRF